jgi:hypothetical protein
MQPTSGNAWYPGWIFIATFKPIARPTLASILHFPVLSRRLVTVPGNKKVNHFCICADPILAGSSNFNNFEAPLKGY